MGFDSLAELEAFWARISPADHKAWSQRMQHHIVDSSPVWHILRACPATVEDAPALSSQAEVEELPPDLVRLLPLPLPGLRSRCARALHCMVSDQRQLQPWSSLRAGRTPHQH